MTLLNLSNFRLSLIKERRVELEEERDVYLVIGHDYQFWPGQAKGWGLSGRGLLLHCPCPEKGSLPKSIMV